MRLISIVLVANFSLLLSCSRESGKKEEKTITIFHAGSLSKPLKTIANSFMVENHDVKVLLEAAGSVECARKITELGRSCDLLFSADYKVIDQLLIPNYASWNILFAGNEMSIVYTPKSKFANEINQQNWFEILLKPEVFFGRSDPDADPCGYRTVLTLQLAEIFYGEKDLVKRFIEKDKRFIRPKEVDLIALLETGAIDYIFLYRSVAIQHGLNYLQLPDSINLGKPELESVYSTSSLKIKGSSPGDTLIVVGEPMVYGFTMPKTGTNSKLVEEFANYFIDKQKGLKMIEQSGMPVLNPLVVKNSDKLPESIRSKVKL